MLTFKCFSWFVTVFPHAEFPNDFMVSAKIVPSCLQPFWHHWQSPKSLKQSRVLYWVISYTCLTSSPWEMYHCKRGVASIIFELNMLPIKLLRGVFITPSASANAFICSPMSSLLISTFFKNGGHFPKMFLQCWWNTDGVPLPPSQILRKVLLLCYPKTKIGPVCCSSRIPVPCSL